jgi:hypothetical protein
VITNSGNGYQFIPPAVIIQNGGGATAEAILRDGQVVGINITNQGTGIFQTPTITIDVPPSTNVIEGQYKTVNYGDLWTGGLKWSYLYSNAPSEDYSYLGGYFLYNSVVFFAASGLQLFPTYDIGKGVCLIQMQISFVPPTGFTLQGFGFGLTTNFGSTVPTPYENSGTTFAYTSPIATVGSVLTSGLRIIESKTFFCSYGGNTTTTVAPYFYVSGSVYTTGFNVQLTMNTIRLA